MFVDGELTINGAITGDKLGTDKIRSYNKIKGRFKLGYGVDLQLETGQVSDEAYLNDYGYIPLNELNSKIVLSKEAVNNQVLLKVVQHMLEIKLGIIPFVSIIL